MAINKKAHFRGNDFNNQDLKDAKSLQLNEDAVNSDDAVRKSQAETISDQSAQDILVSVSNLASATTAFTSQSLVGFLSAKQDNMSIEANSTGYLEIVNGTEIKVKQLLVSDVKVDAISSTLSHYLTANPSHGMQEGDVLILTSATDNQQRTWINNGGSNGDEADFTRLQTDYNEASIRAMFSVGTYLNYDAGSGLISIDRGINAGQLGAQTLPADATQFNVITGATVETLLMALEAFIVQVDANATGGSTTIDTRLTTLSGVSGNNLGAFAGSTFGESKNIKQILQESEVKHESADADRGAIRSEATTANTQLQANIDAENLRALSAEASESSSRQSADNGLQASINITNANLQAEETRAVNAEVALDSRLDIVEGTDIVEGSIKKAEKDAKDFATLSVNNEATARANADLILQNQIDAIADAFQYKGSVGIDQRITHIDTLHANHNKMFANASFEAGDMYKMNADVTLTFADSSQISVIAGDSLVALTPCPAGTCVSSDFHKWDNTESADILREGQLESGYLRRDNGTIEIIADSLDRSKLHGDVKTDIDNKVLKSGDIMTGALKIDKVVTNNTYAGGYDYAQYIKQKSVNSASLTDTQRALLVENEVYTSGSGNPYDLDYANATTSASHYKGASTDMSVSTAGVNGEANVTSPSSAVYATGVYGLATSSHLGVNGGGVFVAQNGATSNLGVFGFTDTAGALNNRAGYFALAPDSLDFDGYRVARVLNPLPVQDAVMLLDDYTGTKHALYVNGKSEFIGKVILPSATADNEAVNLGDVKAKEYFEAFTIDENGNTVINHGLGSKKLVLSVWHNDEEATSSFDVEKTSNNSITIYNGTSEALTGLEICIYKLSV